MGRAKPPVEILSYPEINFFLEMFFFSGWNNGMTFFFIF